MLELALRTLYEPLLNKQTQEAGFPPPFSGVYSYTLTLIDSFVHDFLIIYWILLACFKDANQEHNSTKTFFRSTLPQPLRV